MTFAGRTATAIIPFPPNKILLIKRRTVPFSGYWALPGGRVDSGETVEQTIVREVKEETSLEVAVVSKIGDYHEQGVQDGAEYDYYPACFLVKTLGGEIKKQESEIEEIKLFSRTEVFSLSMEMSPAQTPPFSLMREVISQKAKLQNTILHHQLCKIKNLYQPKVAHVR